MSKNPITIKMDAKKLNSIRRRIQDTFTEDAADAANALRDLIDELENSEVEVDEKSFVEKVREIIESFNGDENAEVPAAVANAIAQKMKTLQDSMPKSDKLTPAIKNQVAAAILRSHSKDEAIRKANEVMVKNGISGMTFENAVDYAISDKWGENNELFNALRKVPFSKFHYTTQDLVSAGVINPDVSARGWDKASESDKACQSLTVTGKTIATQYIYKRLDVAFEDLDDIDEAGQATAFLNWVSEELDRQIVNTIVAIMLGNNHATPEITSVENLLAAASDAFRTAVTVTNAAAVTLPEARAICDAGRVTGQDKWAIMSQSQLTTLAEFVYASGGSTGYMSAEDVAGMLGVQHIYVTDLATTFICFIPDEYWVKEKKYLSVTYPTYERNEMNYQKERNLGSAIHGLKTVAFGVQ